MAKKNKKEVDLGVDPLGNFTPGTDPVPTTGSITATINLKEYEEIVVNAKVSNTQNRITLSDDAFDLEAPKDPVAKANPIVEYVNYWNTKVKNPEVIADTLKSYDVGTPAVSFEDIPYDEPTHKEIIRERGRVKPMGKPGIKKSISGRTLNSFGLTMTPLATGGFVAGDENDERVFFANSFAEYIQLATEYTRGATATKEPLKPDLTEYTYRCILTDDGVSKVFLKVPKGLDLPDNELVAAGYEGRENIRVIDYLPNRENTLNFKPKSKFIPKKKDPIKYIRASEFITKTNDQFIDFKPLTLDLLYKSLVESRGRGAFLDSITETKCNRFEVLFDKATRTTGMTTGVVKNGLVQVIALTHDTGSTSDYDARSYFAHGYMDGFVASYITSGNSVLKFFRIKIISASKTNSLMTNYKNHRNKIVGEIYGSDRAAIGSYDFEGKGYTTCIQIYSQHTDNTLRFHPEDLELRIVNLDKVPPLVAKNNKEITQNSICTIVDDRRLTGLTRGDQVKVISIKPSKANMKNSIVTVMELKSKNRFIVLLKQLKKNVDQTQK